MKSSTFRSFVLALTLILGIAGSSQAATSVTSTVNLGLGASTTGSSASMNSNTNASMNSSSSAGAGMHPSSQSSTTQTSTSGSAASTDSASMNTDTSASVNAMGGILNISISGDSVRTSSASGSSVSSPVQVQTGSDLQAYAEGVARTDTSVSAVSTTDSDVDVTFKRPAKLFGFIPTTVNETARVSVNSDGTSSVAVHKSWWAFLASSDTKTDELSSSIESKVTAHGSLSASADAGLSSQAKALLISDIQSSAQAVYGASMNASASTDASASYSY